MRRERTRAGVIDNNRANHFRIAFLFPTVIVPAQKVFNKTRFRFSPSLSMLRANRFTPID
jgi:hypothetical protein